MRIGIHYPIFIVSQWNVIRACNVHLLGYLLKPFHLDAKIKSLLHSTCHVNYICTIRQIYDITFASEQWVCIECLMSLGRVCTSVVFLFRGNPLPQNLSRYITTIFRVFTWLWIYRFDFVWVENQIQSIISAECTSKCGLQTNMFEKCLEMMKNFLMCQQWWMPKFQK